LLPSYFDMQKLFKNENACLLMDKLIVKYNGTALNDMWNLKVVFFSCENTCFYYLHILPVDELLDMY
jgi:hypothetical protein